MITQYIAPAIVALRHMGCAPDGLSDIAKACLHCREAGGLVLVTYRASKHRFFG